MHEDFQDEEDPEDDDEGIVEGQLELNDHHRHGTAPPTPPQTTLCVGVSLSKAYARLTRCL